jgi:hypothetical protein
LMSNCSTCTGGRRENIRSNSEGVQGKEKTG